MTENWEAVPSPLPAGPWRHAREQALPQPGVESVTDAVIALLRERQAKGIATYGTSLFTFNGRDAGRDLVEELADGLQYAMQMRLERQALEARLAAAEAERDMREAQRAHAVAVLERTEAERDRLDSESRRVAVANLETHLRQLAVIDRLKAAVRREHEQGDRLEALAERAGEQWHDRWEQAEQGRTQAEAERDRARDSVCVPVNVEFIGWSAVDTSGPVTDRSASTIRVRLTPQQPFATLRVRGGREVNVSAWANKTDIGPACNHEARYQKHIAAADQAIEDLRDRAFSAEQDRDALRARAERAEAALTAMRPVVEAARTWNVAYYSTPADMRKRGEVFEASGMSNGAPYWEIAALMDAVAAYEQEPPARAGEVTG